MRRMKIYFHAPRQFFVLDPLFKMQRKRDNAEGSEDGGEEDEGEERRSRMKARSAAFDLQDGRGARDEAPVCACCMGVVGSPPERLEEMRTEEMAEEEKRMEQQRGCEGAREQRRPRALGRLAGGFGRDEREGGALGRYVAGSTGLRTLVLAGNRLGAEGSAEVMRGLVRSKSLVLLGMLACGCGEEATRLLAGYLSSAGSLRRVGYSCNPVGDAGALAIADALQSNFQLDLLELDSCGISSGGMDRFLARIETAPGPWRLMLSGNPGFSVDSVVPRLAELSLRNLWNASCRRCSLRALLLDRFRRHRCPEVSPRVLALDKPVRTWALCLYDVATYLQDNKFGIAATYFDMASQLGYHK